MVKDKKAVASWSSVKAGLRGFDRTALLGLIQDLYATSKDNQAFLHARLNLCGDPLKPYKAVISRWVCPDIFKNQPVSVAKAKKAIADYKKAIGYPEGLLLRRGYRFPARLRHGRRRLSLRARAHVQSGAEIGHDPSRKSACASY